MIPLDLARKFELGEPCAYGDFWSVTASGNPDRTQNALQIIGGAFCGRIRNIVDPLWQVVFNSVIALGVTEPATEAIIERISAYYRQAATPFSIRFSASAQPAELSRWLQARGFHVALNVANCYCSTELSPWVETELEILQIGSDQAATFAQLASPTPELQNSVAGLVGRSEWRHYLAYDGDRAVASAALYIQNNLGWLGWAFTQPSHRCRGIHGALMTRRIRDAATLG